MTIHNHLFTQLLVYFRNIIFDMEKQVVLVEELGIRPYEATWNYQEKLLKQNTDLKQVNRQLSIANDGNAITELSTINFQPLTTNHLLLLEHPPVYTLGKSGHESNILISETERAEKGIEYFKINRGGDITFHGLGQLVGYPILDLEKFTTDLGKYLRNLEEVIIKTIAEYGLHGKRSPGETGVWLDPGKKGLERKICAMGIRCSRWITMHGWALNVNTDMRYFDYIIPCGIQNKQVTSMEKELGYTLDMSEVITVLKGKFEEVFNVELVGVNQSLEKHF
jgi:lipoyl(octanoyl) transferase